MTLQLIPDAPGDVHNAQYLATAADLAYLDASAGPPAFKERLGLDAKLISRGNTQVYVGTDDKNIVVAFRGSESPNSFDGLKDWLLTNANNFLILPEGAIGTDYAAAGVGARFHRGFMEALESVWDPLFKAVNSAFEEEERLIWITGHSLGGALALLAAWRLQRKFLEVHQVYTFGAPMIGNAAAAAAYEKTFPNRIFRFVDGDDPVPLLPTMSLVANAYGHCLTEVPLRAVAVAGEAAGSTVGVLKAFAGRTTEGLLDATLIDELWDALKGRITAHFMTNYEALLEDKLKELG